LFPKEKKKKKKKTQHEGTKPGEKRANRCRRGGPSDKEGQKSSAGKTADSEPLERFVREKEKKTKQRQKTSIRKGGKE